MIKLGVIKVIHRDFIIQVKKKIRMLTEKLEISNIKEVAARGAYIIAVATEGTPMIDEAANEVFYIPKVKDENTGFLTIIIHQLMAYYLSALKGLDVDKPRNLAKSVTVE